MQLRWLIDPFIGLLFQPISKCFKTFARSAEPIASHSLFKQNTFCSIVVCISSLRETITIEHKYRNRIFRFLINRIWNNNIVFVEPCAANAIWINSSIAKGWKRINECNWPRMWINWVQLNHPPSHSVTVNCRQGLC